MKCSNKATKLLTVLILAAVCSSAMAEYKAITKFKRCELVGSGPEYCKSLDRKGESMNDEIQPSGAEEADVKACDAIADNINEMSKANYDWNYGFAISANNYLLANPQWMELSEKERCDSLSSEFSEKINLADCKKDEYGPVFMIADTFNFFSRNEYIYIRKHRYVKSPSEPFIRVFWTTNKNKVNNKNNKDNHIIEKEDSDPVVFSSRLYFVEYDRDIPGHEKNLNGENGFAIYALRHNPIVNNDYTFICAIKSVPSLNQTNKIKE